MKRQEISVEKLLWYNLKKRIAGLPSWNSASHSMGSSEQIRLSKRKQFGVIFGEQTKIEQINSF
nr:hypothetical protein [Acetivibrio clariflavus]